MRACVLKEHSDGTKKPYRWVWTGAEAKQSKCPRTAGQDPICNTLDVLIQVNTPPGPGTSPAGGGGAVKTSVY